MVGCTPIQCVSDICTMPTFAQPVVHMEITVELETGLMDWSNVPDTVIVFPPTVIVAGLLDVPTSAYPTGKNPFVNAGFVMR